MVLIVIIRMARANLPMRSNLKKTGETGKAPSATQPFLYVFRLGKPFFLGFFVLGKYPKYDEKYKNLWHLVFTAVFLVRFLHAVSGSHQVHRPGQTFDVSSRKLPFQSLSKAG